MIFIGVKYNFNLFISVEIVCEKRFIFRISVYLLLGILCLLILGFSPICYRRIASLQVDQNTVSTFELYLTLKHDRSGWTSILPQFLK